MGYTKAKNIGMELGSKSLKEQFYRCRAFLDNLIITDYLDPHLFLKGGIQNIR
jgi:hypothetical protein